MAVRAAAHDGPQIAAYMNEYMDVIKIYDKEDAFATSVKDFVSETVRGRLSGDGAVSDAIVKQNRYSYDASGTFNINGKPYDGQYRPRSAAESKEIIRQLTEQDPDNAEVYEAMFEDSPAP
jgi:hypothetical protein